MAIGRLPFSSFARALGAGHLVVDAVVLAGDEAAANPASLGTRNMGILGRSKLGNIRPQRGRLLNFLFVCHLARETTTRSNARAITKMGDLSSESPAA